MSTSLTKGRYDIKHRGNECLNCGHPLQLSDKFCPNCSQANSTKKLNVKDFIEEFFGSLISYDSKLLSTLSAMLIKPGKITKDYIDGKRAAYTNPFRFLLSLSIIYFLIVTTSGNFEKWDKYGEQSDQSTLDNILKFNFIENDFKLSDSLDLSKIADTVNIEQGLTSLQNTIAKQDSLILANPKKYFQQIESDNSDGQFTKKQAFFRTVISKDTVYDLADAQDKYDIKSTTNNRLAFSSAKGVIKLQKSPGSFVSGLISKIPFAIFLFLPLFTIFLFLVYIRKKNTYTDHLIFSFHNTSLLFILLIISNLIDAVFDIQSNWIFLLIFCLYLFIAMYRFYEQGIFKTTIKYVFLNIVFLFLGIIIFIGLFAGNIFTF